MKRVSPAYAALTVSRSESEADGTTRVALERAVHGARVSHEIRARPGISTKEFMWKHVALEPIARGTCGNKVALRVRTTMGDRVYVIERRNVERQWNGAVDAASAAVTHGSVLESALDGRAVEVASAARQAARCAGERDSVETTSRHCTSLEKKNPRDGTIARAGEWRERRLTIACRCGLSGCAGRNTSCRRRSFIGLRGQEVA